MWAGGGWVGQGWGLGQEMQGLRWGGAARKMEHQGVGSRGSQGTRGEDQVPQGGWRSAH